MEKPYKKPEMDRVNSQLIYGPGEWEEIDRYIVTTGRIKGREFVKAMLAEIARERDAGRWV